MEIAYLEHINLTVSDLDKTANMLCELFGWTIRWRGASIEGGETVHVGGKDSYLAIYKAPEVKTGQENTYKTIGSMNHIGIVVDDLDAMEIKVKAMGYEPKSHADYEPGRRFYFEDHDQIEFEIINYS